MNEILLSVIIPCYNSAYLLKRTLSLYEKENLQWVEFIIVDDCSTDNSWLEIKEFSLKSNLNIILSKNEKNIGPGEARNHGISLASGRYITFLDSDDRFINSFFYEIFQYVQQGEIDCLIFDYLMPDDKRKSILIKEYSQGVIPYTEAFVFVRGATFGKIYRSEIIKSKGIKFLSLKRNEDMPFTKIALSNMSNVLYIKKPLYFYEQLPSSLMHDKSLLNAENAINACLFIEKNTDDSLKREKEAVYALECIYSAAMTYSLSLKRKQWKEKVFELEKIYPEYLNNIYVKKYPLKYKTILKMIHRKMYCSIKLINKYFR